jgi:hypothetical protein
MGNAAEAARMDHSCSHSRPDKGLCLIDLQFRRIDEASQVLCGESWKQLQAEGNCMQVGCPHEQPNSKLGTTPKTQPLRIWT